ncbi:hypothetical protein BJ878DRAFT_491283 [Calycina marina]|uniref:Uncharacterized protein n=1 Tax=Calycina marina TaxID=1763456 RepID=A0A9P8CHX8_9HELO|nr:hypothetical protein BJ878DRAFT_491283 [Calycina marina]
MVKGSQTLQMNVHQNQFLQNGHGQAIQQNALIHEIHRNGHSLQALQQQVGLLPDVNGSQVQQTDVRSEILRIDDQNRHQAQFLPNDWGSEKQQTVSDDADDSDADETGDQPDDVEIIDLDDDKEYEGEHEKEGYIETQVKPPANKSEGQTVQDEVNPYLLLTLTNYSLAKHHEGTSYILTAESRTWKRYTLPKPPVCGVIKYYFGEKNDRARALIVQVTRLFHLCLGPKIDRSPGTPLHEIIRLLFPIFGGETACKHSLSKKIADVHERLHISGEHGTMDFADLSQWIDEKKIFVMRSTYPGIMFDGKAYVRVWGLAYSKDSITHKDEPDIRKWRQLILE